ncbi:MAG: ABC transporter ATP-binding protein [Planctomycetota bacterium]|nr:MAG: ABC transporter ATP-binding protein [Planctomycetota bacterium]
MADTLLALSGLSKRFGDVLALDDLTLDVSRGEVVGLLGPNGAGKTTAIRLALGLAVPTAGSVRLFGRSPREAAARAGLGYLPGELALDPRLDGHAMLALNARLHAPGDAPPDATRVGELCERLGLSHADLSRPVRDDSSGTRQKLGLVAAWQHDPELLLLDEPTNALDPLVREAVFELLREAAAAGKAVLHSSHVLSEVDRSCNSVAVLRGGRLVERGSVSELRRRLTRHMLVRFRGAPPVAALSAAGAVILERDGARLVLQVAGALDPLLAVLASHPVDELAFPEPDLSAAFAHWYGDAAREARS